MIARGNTPIWVVGFCIFFLLALLSSCYGQDTSAETEPRAEEIPEGASTLAFVFDVTGSMYDDLVQVIEGASKILETSLKRPKRPLYNFALVPFHDPEIGPVTITTDPKKFQYELRELYVQGGGDCPEMSIGAIKIALEISLPGSFIYVFTDARSKDYRLTHEVLQLIQQKQSQVVFVLTGDCDDRSHIGYRVYEEIASTSSGQVFHLDKKQVNEVLKWVEEAVQASKVHLLSTDHLTLAVNTWQIPFDPSLKEVTVSLSGPSPVIEIHDPLGSGLNELLNIHNSAKVVNIKDPEPGMWMIKTSSSGRHSVRITGLSTIDFRAGFSRKPTLDFKKASSRPVQGIPTYVLLNTTGITLPARVDRLELLSITGELLKTMPVKYYPDRKPYGIWNITDFIPPNEAFFVKIMGYDKDDYLFQRVSSVSFSSIVPDAPKVIMPTKTPGYYLQPGHISCHVESLIPFTQRFSRNGIKLGMDQFFKESSSMNWEIAKVSVSDEGNYECIAISNAGTGYAQTFLDVPNNVTVTPGERAILTCLTLSTVRYNLTWQRNGRDMRLVEPSRIRMMSNLSLEVKSVKLTDAGEYSCIASNEGGSTVASVFLTVQEPPKVIISPKNQSFTEGSAVSIMCSATGYPKPKIVWTHNDMFIVGSDRYGTLIIKKATPKDAGLYGCSASNSKCLNISSIFFIQVVPLIGMSPSVTNVIEGQQLTLPCVLLAGNPIPERRWIKNDMVLVPNPYINVRSDGSLHLERIRLQDGGEYTCMASNVAGTNNKTTTVSVFVLPIIQHGQQIFSTIEGIPVTLPCKASGVPKPSIIWSKVTSKLQVVSYAEENLLVYKVPQESGCFCCTQTNMISFFILPLIYLSCLVPPKIQRGPRVMKVQVGHRIDIPCSAQGVPSPTVTWFKDRNIMLIDGGQYISNLDGTLSISKVQLSDSGIYKCIASNVAGNDESEITLQVQGIDNMAKVLNFWLNKEVQITCMHGMFSHLGGGTKIIYSVFAFLLEPPTLDDLDPPYNTPFQERVANQRVAFPCPAKGIPKPAIKWLRNGRELTGNEPGISILEDGTLLIIASVSSYDNGEYVCVAVNEAGSTERKYSLKVHVPPEIQDQEKVANASVVVNQPVSLFCEVTGNPFPIITWYKDDVQVCTTTDNPNIELLDKGQVLRLKSARRLDKGRYQCSVTNTAGKQVKEIKLIIHVPPTIKGGNITTEVSTLLSSLIKLECETRGIPAPGITWYKDGRLIISSPQALYVDRGQFLQIPQAQVSDSAKYTCLVTNSAGTAQKMYQVDVYVPPVIEGDSETIQNKQVVVGNLLTLECKAAGNPSPLLTWLKDGVPVKASDNLRIVSGGKKLEILNAVEADRGQYICVATSIAGEKEIKYNVEILVPPLVEGGEELSNYIVILHSPLELDCLATGTPPPTIMWLKDGQPVEEGDGYKFLSNGHKLLISRAQVSDTGRYKCVVTNKAGDHEKEFDITVHDLYVVQICTISFISVAGSRVIVQNCSLLSVLGQLESSGRILQIARSLLEDAGRYTCVATNAAGEAQQHIRLHVHGNDDSASVTFPILLFHLVVITWYKDSHPLTTAAGVTFLNRGQIVQLDSAQISDTGIYKCMAINTAGAAELFYSLQVHGKCCISLQPLEECAFFLLFSMRLECEARGIPAPILTWLKDGSPVSSFSDGLQVLSGGRVLALTSAQMSDTGKYTCVAVNAAGEKQRDVDLRVYVPPNIMGEEQNVSVLISQAVELRCQSNAIPPPMLTWLKDGRPLLKKPGLSPALAHCLADVILVKTECIFWYLFSVPPSIYGSDELSQLTVIEGSLISLVCESSGIPPPSLSWKKNSELPCIVNSYKRNSSCTKVLHFVSFSSLVRPIILNSGNHLTEVVVTRGNNVSLECKVQGNPQPAITWMKDGHPLVNGSGVEILNDGHLLQLKNAQVSDTGRYVCVALNVAGLTDRKYDLNIHVPPSIVGDLKMPENISVVEKNPVTLICEVSGIPLPSITWLKNGRPILLNSSMRILSGGRTLRSMQTKMEDEGQYTCIVTNTAGEVRKHFGLSVLEIVFYLGNPVPQITWIKDGQPLSEDGDHQILSSGRFLQITNAQVADTGRYTCVASSVAGDTSKSYSLNVLVSPTIVGTDNHGSTEDVTVILNSPTSLACEAYSYPPATITWLKDGVPLESNRNIRILPGRTLQILNAQEDSSGRYTCIATNEAGETLKHYEVKIYIPPIINKGDISGMGLSPKEVKIKVNNSLTLECEAHAIPAAAISWYKDGQVLPEGDGRILQIKEAQVSDTGRYSCVAANIAGEDDMEFDVNIQVPPRFQKPPGTWEIGNTVDIGRGGETKDVIINNPLSLYCETNAVPPPILTWYKDGHLLSSSDKLLILPGGRVLQIPRAQAEDAGRYMCVAVNEAGEDSIQYDVHVLLPPSINGADVDLPEEVTVLVNKTIVMECVANGNPAPRITWRKDGQPLILNSQITDTGRYVCVVENIAGSAKKYFNLNVHVPPSVVGTNFENLTVVVNNFISLTCEVTGFPPPDLSWLKNGKPINLNTNALIVPGGRTLQIPRARLSDGGEYICIARNQAGESKKKNVLTVYVPPSIKDHRGASLEVVTVRVGTLVTLECESNAVPPPVITWYKNGRMITESANIELLADGQMLQIKNAEVSDTGQYVCKAINIAGRDDKNFHLNVYVPPSIEGPEQTWINETISNPVTFACDATGIPPPTLIWLKNGKPIENSDSLEIHILSGGSKLQIARSQHSDTGTYTCLASNVEGKAQKSYLLSIQGTVVTPDRSTLNIFGALTSDMGKYTCVATNPAGEDDRIFNLNIYVPPAIANKKDEAEKLTVLLDASINIECTAVGTPPPQINWLKNGLPLSVSSQIRLLSAGQILRYIFTQVSDVGVYTCVASNRAGVDNKHYNLQVYVPPSMDNAEEIEELTIVKGNPASMMCFTDGAPTPNMLWLKNGQPLNLGTHLTISNQGMILHIAMTESDDTGRFTCTASNEAGEVSKHFTLKVLEPPRINGSHQPEEITVVVNNQVELFCISTGIPVPKITWMKDGRPLPQNDDIHVQRGGEILQIASAQVTDVSYLSYFSYSTVPPNIAGTSGPQKFTVLQNRQVILECKSDAVPPPTIAWLKDGELLQVFAMLFSQICLIFAFFVPTIKGGPETVVVHINKSAVLECVAEGVPTPRITWRKDGAIFAGNNARYSVLEDGSLYIHTAHITDIGRYLCTATNAAGTEHKRIDLQVHVPPSIAPGPTNITVTVNVQTTLLCETTGIPSPAISWKKNGHLLNVDQNQNTYRFLSSGSLLIISPSVDDTAVYECTASNDAGEDQRTIYLIVQVPPSIADEATDLLVTKLSPAVIPCTASGVPVPSIHWTKNGIRLLVTGDGYRILSSGTIEITAAQLDHAGRYTCVARNAAGSAHRHVTLHVQAILVQPGMLDVILNNPILLPCEAKGTPHPVITWQKEGINVMTTVLPSGSLQIARAAVDDAGTYMCVAQNPAGTALGKIKLKVQVPPSIKPHSKEYIVAVDKSATLQCEVEGYPVPEITWHKDGRQVTESIRQRILSTGALQMAFVQPGDAGHYTCMAANLAGSNVHSVSLMVHVLPAFTELPGDIALNKGEQLKLICKATGTPLPKITWTFNNNIVPGSSPLQKCALCSLSFLEPPIFQGDYRSSWVEPLGGNAILNCEVRGDPPPTIQWSKEGVGVQISNRVRQLSNGSLAIYSTISEDAGDYTCVATNDAGRVERRVTLTLQSPPVITVEPAETVIDAGTTAILNCQAIGEPPPTIEWSRQGHPIFSNDRVTVLSNGSLRIVATQMEDTSEYECVARNLIRSVLVRVPFTVQGGPPRARGSVIGNINDVEFGIAFLNSTVTDSPDSDSRIIQAKITNVPRSLGAAMRKLVSILNPIYWATAKEIGEAVNGFTLTNAVFKRETQVEFATGEILRMTQVARGLDSDGALLLDVHQNLCYSILTFCDWLGHMKVSDYTEDYIQTGPGQLYAYSTRLFTIDGVSVPYTWNHTITYDHTRGRMPFLLETLRASSIATEYNPLEETLAFRIYASITKGICPTGFGLDSAGPYCSDEDECAVRNPCSHTCHNAVGTYYCACPRGLTISADGRTCQDIDECGLGGHTCHAGQECENIIGSYRCVVRCGIGFRRTSDGLSCQDIDECRDGTHQCRYNQICENIQGSYRCVCPRGYRSQGAGRPCVDINECEQVPKPCAFQCTNTPGSFKCICPPGQHLLGDGKSCAGLERLPNYGASYNSYNYAQFSPVRDNYQPQQYYRHSSDLYSSYSEYRNSRIPLSRTKRKIRETCPGDIDECENRGACQHECTNTPGSYHCVCPTGYRLMSNGKTCHDVDECLEQNVHCGPNRMCFNTRGSYQCIDTPCPPNYQRDPLSGFCLKNCPPNDLECALSPYALEYKLVSLPFGIAANQDLIRLVVYTQDRVMHPRTTFLMVDEDPTIPFALRDENLKGVVFTTRPLQEPETYRMRVRALSYSADRNIEYQTTFIVYIAVSAYPY
uniref:Hemicentin 1 n=1 Tax=Pelusios castaneus TaxID=367368 RepID=A0A8C8RXS5_9SAUR